MPMVAYPPSSVEATDARVENEEADEDAMQGGQPGGGEEEKWRGCVNDNALGSLVPAAAR
jgi:hypothetical protein